MVRDLDKEASKIRNGNRFIQDSSGTGVFSRDPDRLYAEYTNLRKKIFSTYRGSFNNEATRRELSSYIDEQFIRLVKEYDINSPVDFPGYIKAKLNLRVKSYVESQFKDKGRERLTTEEDEIERMLESEDGYLGELSVDDLDLRDYVFEGADFSNLEVDIINLWLSMRLTEREIITRMIAKYGKSKREIERVMEELKEFVLFKITAYNKE